jgi:Protein of unknown function (DUF3383)
MALDDIVNVRVTINQSTIAQQGFGTPLIYAPTPFGDLVRAYRASDWAGAMVTDGFNVQSSAYQAASAMMAQSPRPSEFKVGKRATAETQLVWLVPVVGNSAAYRVTVDAPDGTSETATFTSDVSATAAEIATGLAAAITALAANVTADGTSGTHVVVTAGTADRVFSFHSMTANLSLENRTAAAGDVGADLTAINAYDPDWYGLALASSSPASIEPAADWVELNRKIFVASTDDMRPLTNVTDDIVSSIDSQNYPRTHVAYSSRAGKFYGAAWLAALLPYEPGQADWKFKQLKGQIADKLAATQAGFLTAKNGSYYEAVIKGRDITGAAKGGDGVFLDLTQLSDWLSARIREGAVAMLTSAPKVAFTDQDAGNKIWGVLKNVLDVAVNNGAVDGEPDTWSIYVPTRGQLSPADRSARSWPGSILSCTPTGAVHSLGTINVYLNVA